MRVLRTLLLGLLFLGFLTNFAAAESKYDKEDKLFEEADAAFRVGDLDGALAKFDAVFALSDGDLYLSPEVWYAKSLILMRQGKDREALRFLEGTVKNAWESLNSLAGQNIYLLRAADLGDWEGGVPVYARVLDPESERMEQLMEEILAEVGGNPAKPDTERLAKYPFPGDAQVLRVRALIKLGEYARALEVLDSRDFVKDAEWLAEMLEDPGPARQALEENLKEYYRGKAAPDREQATTGFAKRQAALRGSEARAQALPLVAQGDAAFQAENYEEAKTLYLQAAEKDSTMLEYEDLDDKLASIRAKGARDRAAARRSGRSRGSDSAAASEAAQTRTRNRESRAAAKTESVARSAGGGVAEGEDPRALMREAMTKTKEGDGEGALTLLDQLIASGDARMIKRAEGMRCRCLKELGRAAEAAAAGCR